MIKNAALFRKRLVRASLIFLGLAMVVTDSNATSLVRTAVITIRLSPSIFEPDMVPLRLWSRMVTGKHMISHVQWVAGIVLMTLGLTMFISWKKPNN